MCPNQPLTACDLIHTCWDLKGKSPSTDEWVGGGEAPTHTPAPDDVHAPDDASIGSLPQEGEVPDDW